MNEIKDRQDDAIQDLARIAQAAVRLMVRMHRSTTCWDPDEEIAHMQANLDDVRRLVSRG